MGDKNTNNTVGASLFAGEHSVFVQNNEQDDDEDEEDRIRRQEELQNLIANAFDNLEYEDNSHVNSSFDSTTSSKYKSNITNTQASGDNFSFADTNYKNTSFNSFEQLQNLYQNRVKESQTLAQELDALKVQFKIEKEQMSRKMLLLEADNNRLNISLKQSQELLVDKTDIIDKKSKEIEDLKEFVENLRSSNEKFEEEILIWKSNSNDLEQKLHLMERGINKNISEKQIRAHYEQEINKLQEILQITNLKLEKNEKEYHELQNQIQEIEHEKEIIIAEKTQVINQVSKNLEESQAQCFSLMNKLTSLQHEKTTLENDLHKKDSTCEKNPTTQNYEEAIVTLREELRRCLEDQSKKRQEINHLEKQIEEMKLKEKHLQELNNKQTKENIQNETLKEENYKLKEDILNLQQKIEEFKGSGKTENFLNSSRSSIDSEKHKEKREEYKKLKEELLKIEKQIQESLNLKDRYIKCEQQCLILQEKIAELNSKLSESQLMITTLKEKLALKEEHDNLIEILKKKAEMFEEYMANKPTQNKSMNTSNYSPEKNKTEIVDDQLNIYTKQLNELEKIVEHQRQQMQILYEENKTLKDKIVFDRNSFNELASIWNQETKKLNKALQLTFKKNEELLNYIDVLKNEKTEKQLLVNSLNSKIEQAKEFINLMEIASTRHSKNVRLEHEQQNAKFETLLGMIEARLSKCIDATKTKVY